MVTHAETWNHETEQQNKNTELKNLPQILIGASSSNKLGCCKKISLAVEHSWRISVSDSWTCFPGRLRTSRSRLIMSSKTACSISAKHKQKSTLLFSDVKIKIMKMFMIIIEIEGIKSKKSGRSGWRITCEMKTKMIVTMKTRGKTPSFWERNGVV